MVLSDKVEETENQYIYTYQADILYKDLAGKEWEGTAKGSFVLGKMEPEGFGTATGWKPEVLRKTGAQSVYGRAK